MSAYERLLMLHITGAFLLMAGGAAAAVLNISARRAETPGEIAVLLRLIQRAVVPVIGAGSLLTLVLGLFTSATRTARSGCRPRSCCGWSATPSAAAAAVTRQRRASRRSASRQPGPRRPTSSARSSRPPTSRVLVARRRATRLGVGARRGLLDRE